VTGRPQNALLQKLSTEDFELLAPHLQSVDLAANHILHHAGDSITAIHFPCGPAFVSFAVAVEDDREVESLLVGREGAIGGIVSQGRLPAYARAEVQLGGLFYRIDLRDLEEAKRQSPTLRNLFARYADCLMAQVFQSVACNAAHTIEQRTAKWLLAAIERTGAVDVALTQEQLAAMLGVGRSYLSRVIHDLRAREVIVTRRKRIGVRNVDRLRSLACECNACVSGHFDNVLEGVYPAEENGLAS